MGVLSNKEPKQVFRFFEEICGIPHGSGNIGRISDYLAAFAKERNLEYYQDELKNIIIIKEASQGYEQEEPVILQGHMDMVAVKKPDCKLDLSKDPLELAVEGDYLFAQGTSLGGDDGIAVAYALALLDSDTIAHPRLEVVITVDEETGMEGARGIDLSMLKGHTLINLDSEEEGIFLTSCAGGARVNCHIPVSRQTEEGTVCSITIKGLQGGHSGCEIHKERGNSNSLMGRLLAGLIEEDAVFLANMHGGLADNAIPRETEAKILVKSGKEQMAEDKIAAFEREVKREFAAKDPGFCVSVRREGNRCENVYTKESAARAVSLMFLMPNGIQAMSADIPGLVETSLNFGILHEDGKETVLSFSVRSCMESAKGALIGKMRRLTALCGGTCAVTGEYPGWAYRKDSPLREKMVRVYSEMYGKAPEIQAIHAGLECGLLAEKIPDLDCVSLGPNMKDIHTTEEKLSISSVKRVWEYCLEVLKQK